MDLIKTSLIAGIAITLYYLLLQWPSEAPALINSNTITNENIVIDDSKDSHTNVFSPVDDPVVPLADPALAGPMYEMGNKDLLLFIDPQSGQIIGSELRQFKESLGGTESLSVFGSGGGNLYIGNSGFYSSSRGEYVNPNFTNLKAKEGLGGSVAFILSGETQDFYHKRIMTFQESGYSVVVEDIVTSKLDSKTTLTPYVVIERNGINDAKGGFMSPERFAYLGPVFSTTDDAYEKYSFNDIDDAPYRKNSTGGWVALIQHYFLTAWVPDQEGGYKYQGQWGGGSKRFLIGYTSQNATLEPGGVFSTTNTLYVGPKYPAELSKIQENLDLTVDYGFLFWLGKPMYWVLEKGNDIFKNWGMAIIFLTIIIKLITWPLSAKAYTSMGKMRALQPKLVALQERHGDDKQKMSQEMMEFYKKEGVNPLGGCLPMLLQMPFFLAFYWVLLETVELRHSGFLWLNDLSAMDPYFILPILNGLGMYLSQKMTPTPPNADPMQAQMMKFFPVMFAVIFAWFPAGLVLYWLMNMFIQIVQQWWYSKSPTSNNQN